MKIHPTIIKEIKYKGDKLLVTLFILFIILYQPEVVANSYTINILLVIESKLSSSGSQIKLLFKQSFLFLYILFEHFPKSPLK